MNQHDKQYTIPKSRPVYEPEELRDFWPDFTQWLERNMHVYEQFVKMAKQINERGFYQYSGKTIVEAIRWHTNLAESEPSTFKISNDRTADMCRLCMLENEELNGMFRIQERRKR